MTSVLTDVAEERHRQDKKWGEQNHSVCRWLTILGEEFGEACQAALGQKESDPVSYRAELVQVAAVAVAAIESYDRQVNVVNALSDGPDTSPFPPVHSDDEFLESLPEGHPQETA